VDRTACTRRHLHADQHLIDTQHHKEEDLNEEETRKAGLPVDLVVGLVVGLHREVEEEEGVAKGGAHLVEPLEGGVLEDDEVHVEEGETAEEGFPETAGLQPVDLFVEAWFVGIDDVEAGLLVLQGVVDVVARHLQSLQFSELLGEVAGIGYEVVRQGLEAFSLEEKVRILLLC
jgi:hypothetical protein